MAWKTRGTNGTGGSSWSSSDPFTHSIINDIDDDLRTWGGNVDAAGYQISNLATFVVTSSGNVLPQIKTSSAAAVGIELFQSSVTKWQAGVGVGDGSANFNIYSSLSGTTGIRLAITSVGGVLIPSSSLSVTGPDADFTAGGQRALLDFTTNLVRVGGCAGGGANVSLGLYVGAGGSAGEAVRIDPSGNVGIGMNIFPASLVRGLAIANGTAPSANPSGGGVLFVESGALKYRGSSGTVTTLGAA